MVKKDQKLVNVVCERPPKNIFAYFRMKLIHIFLFLNFAATLAYGDDCYSEESKIRRLEKALNKISNKYNGEFELEFIN